MKDKIFNGLRERVKNYLVENHLKASDIKESVIDYNSGHIYLKVSFKDGSSHSFRFFPYNLTRKGLIFVGSTILTTSLGVCGIIGSYKYSTKDNVIKLEKIDPTYNEEYLDYSIAINESLENVVSNDETYDEDTLIEETTSSNEDIDLLDVEPNIPFEYVDSDDLDPYEMINLPSEVVNNSYYRDINIYGSLEPTIDSYDYVLDKYYDAINTYGNRYGIDPAIIAAQIMQECGNARDDELYQTNYNSLGLGQINCSYFDNYVFHTYNFDTNSYEDYTCTYEKLKNNRDEQIKILAMMDQEYAIKYDGNLAAMLIGYNQGVGTVGKIISNIIDCTDCQSRDDVLSSSDISILSTYNYFTYGDPDYYSKVVTFINYELENNVFGKSSIFIRIPEQEEVVEYSTNVEVSSLTGSR